MQGLLDRIAISASALCMVHCLAMPLLVIAIPVLSSTFLADEAFHRFLVWLVLPVSLAALFIGCRRHKDILVVSFGGLGLILLISIAYFGHDLLGESGERIATVVGGVILAVGHFRNYRLCRRVACEA
ncbi:MAG: MerC family mercury resistance protein [Gammaproteobacteria bacterium]|nr:MerC family mercury resistance protein [Gammaproteobacteria bacterium]